MVKGQLRKVDDKLHFYDENDGKLVTDRFIHSKTATIFQKKTIVKLFTSMNLLISNQTIM